MPALFTNIVAVVSAVLEVSVLRRLRQHGATVVLDSELHDASPDTRIDIGVVSAEGRCEELTQSFRSLRGCRVPIVRSGWVDECVRCKAILPVKHPFAVFDPRLFEGVVFSTSGLPNHVKENVVALMAFLRAEYCRHLTQRCNLLIVASAAAATGEVSSSSVHQSKVQAALEMGRRSIAIVPVSWVQQCFRAAALLPTRGAVSTAAQSPERWPQSPSASLTPSLSPPAAMSSAMSSPAAYASPEVVVVALHDQLRPHETTERRVTLHGDSLERAMRLHRRTAQQMVDSELAQESRVMTRSMRRNSQSQQ